MKLFRIKFLKGNDLSLKNNSDSKVDPYIEIGKIVKEARLLNNLSIEDLSQISKIPLTTIMAIENNVENLRPQAPFIKSILYKLEDCLNLKNSQLIELANSEETPVKGKTKVNYFANKFDLMNSSWQLCLTYILMLLISILILNIHYLNTKTIEFKFIDETISK